MAAEKVFYQALLPTPNDSFLLPCCCLHPPIIRIIFPSPLWRPSPFAIHIEKRINGA
jgi:hypothetical protein